jgi:hypothetical protein
VTAHHDRRFTQRRRAPAGLLDLLSSNSANHLFSGVFIHVCPELRRPHNRQEVTPITMQMIRQADYSADNGESGGAGASAGAHHTSHHANQHPNRPVVPIVSQPTSRPVELPPQYRPRKPRKQVNVACQPCRKRRSKVTSSSALPSVVPWHLRKFASSPD